MPVGEPARRSGCARASPSRPLADIKRDQPLPTEDLIEQHLRELDFRNQRHLHERTTYALNLVAAIRGGLEPDIVNDMYWWCTRDIVEYAVIAATAYVCGCAHQQDSPWKRVRRTGRRLSADPRPSGADVPAVT
jgi:hypothetical protein